jgi:CRP/FNR family transcriptional regulator, cyclic AMP receptor protein
MLESDNAIDENSRHRRPAAWLESLAATPAATFDSGETVVKQGTKSGRLLILKKGAVSIFKDGIEIASVSEPGAIFGELSALLDQPHTADVRTIEASEFHFADASMLTREPAALLYVAKLLARRLDLTNRGLSEIKSELTARATPSLIRATLGKVDALLSFLLADYPSTGSSHSVR